MTDPYIRDLPKGATWDRPIELPSPEKMRLEMETGVFSPESLAIADSILQKATDLSDRSAVDSYIDEKPLRDPENDDWWAQQEYFGAPREKSFIEKQTDDIMKRVTKAPLPNASQFKKLSTAAKKTTKAIKRFSREIPKPRVGANLQYRPFLILSVLRDDLTK